jgi:hypothetical protein
MNHENYFVYHFLIWLGGVGRLVDALVWLGTLGWAKTHLNYKITQSGEYDWKERPWLTVVKNHGVTTMEADGKIHRIMWRNSHWLNIVHALVLLIDGVIQTLGLGFIESNFSVRLTFSKWWKAHTYGPRRLRLSDTMHRVGFRTKYY